jgi:hypothetical protein
MAFILQALKSIGIHRLEDPVSIYDVRLKYDFYISGFSFLVKCVYYIPSLLWVFELTASHRRKALGLPLSRLTRGPKPVLMQPTLETTTYLDSKKLTSTSFRCIIRQTRTERISPFLSALRLPRLICIKIRQTALRLRLVSSSFTKARYT